jgi:hypothetical protein
MSYYDWPQIAAKLSNDELLNIIKDKRSEPEPKVTAALKELKNRGFETESYPQLSESVKKVTATINDNAPTLYSDRVIYTFSILFSVIFGGILFAINLKEVNNKKGIPLVIIFTVLYCALSIYVLNVIDLKSSGSFLFGAIGAVILNTVFWNKYIGKEVQYKRKSYKKPLIIALAIFIPLTAFIIWGTIVNAQYNP